MSPSLAFGALALRPGGSGVQTYEREIIAAIAAAPGRGRAWDLAAVTQADAVPELPSGVRPVPRAVGSGVRRALEGLRPVPGVDLFHGLDVDLPLLQRGATVSTVHDMSAFDTPWAMSRVRARGEQALLRRSLSRADRIIAVSAFTAERVEAITGRGDAVVVPLAPAPWVRVPSRVETEAVRAKYDLPEEFVLQLATLEPRKRSDVVAEALLRLDRDVPLVLAGAGTDGPTRPAGTLGLGYVDREDVPALYRAATVVAYASSYEGYGLPPVEAMACGAVVVASDAGAIAEATADGALLVESLDSRAWARALRSALDDRALRTDLLAAGRRRAAELDWVDAAEATLEVYATLV